MQDRLYTRATWGNTDFVVVDTGGLMSKAAQLPDGQRAAAERAISAVGLPQVPCNFSLDSHTEHYPHVALQKTPCANAADGLSSVCSDAFISLLLESRSLATILHSCGLLVWS